MVAEKKNPKQQAPSSDDEWKALREGWAAEQVNKAHAHLLAKFDTDEDMPLSRHLLLFAIASFFILFFIWANLAKLDEVARGEGKIVPSSDVKTVQREESGIVDEILVKEGDEVTQGQILMRLSDIAASSDLGANQARYLGLLASITRLQAEAEGKTSFEFPAEIIKNAPSSVTEEMNSFRANQLQLQGQLNIFMQQQSQREQEVRELSQRASDIRGVIALQREEKAMVEPLVAKGSAPRMELLQLERTIKEKQTELNSVQSNLPRAQSAVSEARARIEDLKSSAKAQAQTELSAKLIEMNEAKERVSGLTERKTRKEIASPVNGIIQEITAKTIGGVIKPGEDIIKVVPKDDQLVVEARVKPADRAFIAPGQKAVVKLTSYDFSIYGGLEGKLTYISQDTYEDQKGNVYYNVRVETEKNHLVYNGEKKQITTGMVASVDILTGQKTVMQYLLKPFVKTLEKAMNER